MGAFVAGFGFQPQGPQFKVLAGRLQLAQRLGARAPLAAFGRDVELIDKGNAAIQLEAEGEGQQQVAPGDRVDLDQPEPAGVAVGQELLEQLPLAPPSKG